VSAEALRVLADVSGFRARFRRREHMVELALSTNRCGEVVVVGGVVGSSRRRAGAR